jgi:hypothetical protein
MNEEERKALRELRFDSAQTSAGVWKALPYHVSELHREAMRRIADGLEDAARCVDDSPLGVVVQGQAGAGKTHLLGSAREHTQRSGGYFSLVELNDAVPFWTGVAETLQADLLRPGAEKRSQLHEFLDRLAVLITVPADVREIVLGERGGLTKRVLGVFVDALRRHDGTLGLAAQDTLRALILLGSNDFAAQDIGQAHLQSVQTADVDDRAAWGLRQPPKTPLQVVHDISCLLALTGPTVIAIDQLDGLFARTSTSTLHSGSNDDPAFRRVLGEIADGLLTLRQITRRTLTVITCLPDIWVLIKEHAAGPVPHRFRETYTLDRIPTGEVARAIVAKRFAERFAAIRFEPPYPTWPIAAEAFDRPVMYTPRKLIQRVEAHITQCLRNDRVVALRNLDAGELEPFAAVAAASGHTRTEPGCAAPKADPALFAEFDARFASLRGQKDIAGALDPATEDRVLSTWLAAGLRSWIIEAGVSEEVYKAVATAAPRPGVHATLRCILDPDYELDRRWSFRGIAATNAIAAMSRIKTANTVGAPTSGQCARRLILLRNTPWPSGRKTSEVVEAFLRGGGEVRTLSEPDLRTFAALEVLIAEDDERLPLWLADRRPAMGTTLLREVLGDEAPVEAPAEPSTSPESAQPPVQVAQTLPAPPPAQTVLPPPEAQDTEIPLGAAIADGTPYRVGLEALRKHTIVFAGSGSGKTVLVRRLIEECAIKGVSSIVLDPNNDLARLGEPWPRPPSAWGDQDAGKAAEYLAAADVVIWTPGVSGGRPLVLPSLPDISAAPEGSDEQRELVDEAVSILAPRARLSGASGKAAIGEAVLRQALLYHARNNPEDCTSLRAFIAQLSRLPETALSASISGGQKIAGDLAGLLEAARTNDPLFGGSGTPLDPGALLTPAPGRRARVSVISFVGLGSEEQRQAFVNQLQIALFGWIKAHPARERPLSGLYIMDEAQTFAPTSGKTACTDSTNRLVSQARKYGLGLVFATQAPRNLQTKIANNCATQFLGVLSGTANLEAAWDLARSKGSSIEDIGVLETGQFYAARPGEGFAKIRTPLCLTHHTSALTREEIVLRAAPGPGRRRKHAAETRFVRGDGR